MLCISNTCFEHMYFKCFRTPICVSQYLGYYNGAVHICSASKMTCIVSGGELNSTHSLILADPKVFKRGLNLVVLEAEAPSGVHGQSPGSGSAWDQNKKHNG